MEPTLWNAVLASLVAGALATGLGALPAVALRDLSARARATLSGFSAGVMLAASFFSLIVPGLEMSAERWGRPGQAAMSVLGLAAGAGTIALMHRFAPHEHFLKGVESHAKKAVSRVWLFVIAIALHNFPEGMAVGVGVATGEARISLPITVGIGLQNMPEGLVVAVSLLQVGYDKKKALWIAFLTGLVEPFGAALGFGAIALSRVALPIGLLFAAGAMLFVILDEIIPESHRDEHALAATWATLLGFAVMMVLDTSLAPL